MNGFGSIWIVGFLVVHHSFFFVDFIDFVVKHFSSTFVLSVNFVVHYSLFFVSFVPFVVQALFNLRVLRALRGSSSLFFVNFVFSEIFVVQALFNLRALRGEALLLFFVPFVNFVVQALYSSCPS